MIEPVLVLTRVLCGAAALIGFIAAAGCASVTSSGPTRACPDGQERIRVGPRGKGDAPDYICRDKR